jgi:hypothetical protein
MSIDIPIRDGHIYHVLPELPKKETPVDVPTLGV